jgi:site-specific recombinase XerD
VWPSLSPALVAGVAAARLAEHAIALRQSLIILKGLFAFLVSQSYVAGNPFAAVALPSNPQRPLGSTRAFTYAQWDHIDPLLYKRADDEVRRRLRRGMRWLYATGLRLAEITKVKCEVLVPSNTEPMMGQSQPTGCCR